MSLICLLHLDKPVFLEKSPQTAPSRLWRDTKTQSLYRNPIFHGPDGILKEFLKQPFLNCPHNCKSLCVFTQRANCFTRTYIFCLTFNAVYGLQLRCFPSLKHSVILLQSLENLATKTCARFCMLRPSKYKVVSNFTDTLYLLPHKYENLPFSV